MNNALLTAVWLVIATALTGCIPGAIGRMSSTQKSYTGTESLVVSPPSEADAMNTVIEVGKSLGYEVAGRDTVNNRVTLVSANSQAEKTFLGHSIMHRIMVRQQLDKLIFTLMAQGNFGAADSDKADQLLQDFKTKVAARLGVSNTNTAR